jgi:type II secretory pathway pseudopilin PulG
MTRKAEGFALIDLIFTCGLIGLLSAIAVPGMLQAKQAAGAASAIGSMRAISSAQLTYAITCGNGFYAPSLPVLGTPPPGSNESFIGGGLGDGAAAVHSGYTIRMAATPYAAAPQACNGASSGETGQGYRAAADPLDPTNPRFFATNANQEIYEDSATMFAAMPEAGEPAAGAVLR